MDFELAGIGIKEFDIAWAIILRPGQKFLKTSIEVETFLNGYKKLGTFNREYVKYYMILIYSWFYKIGDEEYKKFVLNLLNKMINK